MIDGHWVEPDDEWFVGPADILAEAIEEWLNVELD